MESQSENTEIAALKDRIFKLEKVLEFYAIPYSWKSNGVGPCIRIHAIDWEEILVFVNGEERKFTVGGKRARKALGIDGKQVWGG